MLAAANRIFASVMPPKYKLPYLYWLERFRSHDMPELWHLNRFFAGTGTAIDAGANAGLFTYRLSKHFRHVHAFDVNTDLTKAIADYNPGNITLYPCGLSSAARTAKLRIPVVKGFESNGWGTVEDVEFPDAEHAIEKEVQLMPLDEFSISGVDFVKIDVEGHELEVLKGGAATIDKSRPVLLVEVRAWNLPAVGSWFQSRDYRQISLARAFQSKENENFVFVPAEKLTQLAIKDESGEWAPVGHGA
jgi:FkbM family methyltransferase